MRVRSSYIAVLTILWPLLATAQTPHGPLQHGVPGYASSSWGTQLSEPETGLLDKGFYINKYFDLSFPLPANWREDYVGPSPSAAGYYVLEELRPEGELNGTILIAAQDILLMSWANNSMDLLKRRQELAVASTLKIEASTHEIKAGSNGFARLDYSGAGLFHTVFGIDMRCHVIIFEITTRDHVVLEKLVANMNNLVLPATANPATGGGPFPRCLKDYAAGPNLLQRIDPVQIGPRFTKVPVRIIIGKDGKVRHIHVINALPEQARSVKDALAQWLFKPYLEDGKPVEVETAIVFDFSARKKNPAPAPQQVVRENLQ